MLGARRTIGAMGAVVTRFSTANQSIAALGCAERGPGIDEAIQLELQKQAGIDQALGLAARDTNFILGLDGWGADHTACLLQRFKKQRLLR